MAIKLKNKTKQNKTKKAKSFEMSLLRQKGFTRLQVKHFNVHFNTGSMNTVWGPLVRDFRNMIKISSLTKIQKQCACGIYCY